MNNATMEQLMDQYYSARRKRTLGIIFTAIAGFLSLIGLFAIPLIILSLPFYGVGIPFLIIGIVCTATANRQIALARMKQQAPAPAPQQIHQAPQAPVTRQAPPVQQIPPVQQPAPTLHQQASEQQKDFVDIDWQKYSPLDAGISYNPTKNYGFHRAEGFVGSAPQSFVNRTFPKCPICCTPRPDWTIAQHNQMSWKGNLYLFKCSCCDGIISMSMPDVTTLGNGGGGVASNPTVGLTNLIVKASSGKEAGAVYAVIESVGRSGVTPACQGKEFKLEHLQDMFLRM